MRNESEAFKPKDEWLHQEEQQSALQVKSHEQGSCLVGFGPWGFRTAREVRKMADTKVDEGILNRDHVVATEKKPPLHPLGSGMAPQDLTSQQPSGSEEGARRITQKHNRCVV